MNILDENIPKPQRELLTGWRIAVRQIGVSIGQRGMLDEEIMPLLQRLRRPTFFTRDADFYERHLCHTRYGLVYLSVEKSEAALFASQTDGKGQSRLAHGNFLLAAASIERTAHRMEMTLNETI